MRRSWITGLAALAAVAIAAPARAADHGDNPHMAPDPSGDITDVYSWMSGDGKIVYLAMDVFPNATAQSKFSNVVAYVFHTKTNKSFLDGFSQAQTGKLTPVDLNDVICTFDANQVLSCWIVDVAGKTTKDFVTGDASMAAKPLASMDGKIQVFAGLRDDPFFFNVQGFKVTAGMVATGKTPVTMATFTPDAKTTCPTNVDPVKDAPAYATALKSNAAGMPGTDDFTKGGVASPSGNVLSIVLGIDKTLLTSQTGTVLGVWGATTTRK